MKIIKSTNDVAIRISQRRLTQSIYKKNKVWQYVLLKDVKKALQEQKTYFGADEITLYTEATVGSYPIRCYRIGFDTVYIGCKSFIDGNARSILRACGIKIPRKAKAAEAGV